MTHRHYITPDDDLRPTNDAEFRGMTRRRDPYDNTIRITDDERFYAYAGYTSDDSFAKPLIHQSLYDIVVKKHNGSIHFSDEGDHTVLFLPDVRDVGDRGDRYMVYFWNK